MKIPEFNNKVLNIFTDASASVNQNDSNVYISCSGAVAYTGTIDDCTMVDETFQMNWDSTNNNGEVIAISKGIELAIKYKNQFEGINLFSDSKICIWGLREWVANWVENSNGNLLIGSQGTPVASQEVIVRCIDLIMQNELHIKLYHQKGHANDRNLSKSIQTFKSTNHISAYVTNEFIHCINSKNEYVDMKSRAILMENYENIPQQKTIHLARRVYDPNMDIKKYLKLVTN